MDPRSYARQSVDDRSVATLARAWIENSPDPKRPRSGERSYEIELPSEQSRGIMSASEPSASSSTLCLDQFLKLVGVADTGGQAKLLIQNGDVRLNGVVETRRRKKLNRGDVVEVNGRTLSPNPYL